MRIKWNTPAAPAQGHGKVSLRQLILVPTQKAAEWKRQESGSWRMSKSEGGRVLCGEMGRSHELRRQRCEAAQIAGVEMGGIGEVDRCVGWLGRNQQWHTQ